MSRIGRKPISLPAGVEVAHEGAALSVEGPLGRLERVLPEGVTIKLADNQVFIGRASDSKVHRALHGLSRTLVANMVDGVSKGYAKSLELVGVGYRAAKQGDKLLLTVGYSHPVAILPPAGIVLEVPTPNKIIVKGIDKEAVGSMAAKIRAVREPEPYKGKGIKYEPERIRRKVGKTGK
ncbi:MAG: 50S ribosomal protein L6 [Syntrophomonadaceae bacterium]|nr:50S ribosomal protein L6 [Bacillota bacterium]